MAVEQTSGGTVYTGDDIHKFRIVTMAHAMYAELKGLKLYRGRSIFARVRDEFGLRGSRQSIYEQFCRMHSMEPRS